MRRYVISNACEIWVLNGQRVLVDVPRHVSSLIRTIDRREDTGATIVTTKASVYELMSPPQYVNVGSADAIDAAKRRCEGERI